MKKIFAVFLVVGLAYGQVINNTTDGVTHKVFQVYAKSAYTSSTANETTNYVPIGGWFRLSVLATATDTVKAGVFYQLKNSFTGMTIAFAKTFDSLGTGVIGTSSATAPQKLHSFVVSDSSKLGYDLIRFYIDYTTYLGVAYTGGAVKIYTDIYKP
jgi:hypothetical protein